METKLIALRADLDMLNAVVREEHQKLLNDLTHLVQTEIVDPTGAYLSRLSTEWSLYDDKIRVIFELVFLDENNKEDFGSGCWFEYNSRGLNINHGTIGCWTKEDKHQISRIKMLSYVCDMIPYLEAKFQEILDNHEVYIEHEKRVWSTRAEIAVLKKSMKQSETSMKMNSIQIGCILYYPEQCNSSNRLFSTDLGCNQWRVEKIGEKTITLTSLDNGVRRRISKSDIYQHIMNFGLEIINEEV